MARQGGHGEVSSARDHKDDSWSLEGPSVGLELGLGLGFWLGFLSMVSLIWEAGKKNRWKSEQLESVREPSAEDAAA